MYSSVQALQALLLSGDQVEALKGMSYVLYAVRQYDSIAQISDSPSGVKYYRLLSATLDTLNAIKVSPEERSAEGVAYVKAFEANIKTSEIANVARQPITIRFAGELYRQIRARFDAATIFQLQVLGIFDPFFADRLPAWQYGTNTSHITRANLTKELEKAVEEAHQAIVEAEESATSSSTGSLVAAVGGKAKSTIPASASGDETPGVGATPKRSSPTVDSTDIILLASPPKRAKVWQQKLEGNIWGVGLSDAQKEA